MKLDVSALCLGTMNFGTRIDESTSFALLNRFFDAGGTFFDTSNNYNQWLGGGDGGESEALIGRWLRSRGLTDEVTVATKVGARTTVPGDPDTRHREGLSRSAVRQAAEGSIRRLGRERLDLYYAHVDDREVPLEETVGAFAELASQGTAGVLGCSNITTWRLAEARQLAGKHGWAPYTCVQQMHTYMYVRPERQSLNVVTDELVDYADAHPNLTLLCYSPLFAGYYARRRQQHALPRDSEAAWRRLEPSGTAYDHPSNWHRLEVLDQVAAEVGATPNQVVLAWLLGAETQFVPVFSASSLVQMEECLGALDLALDPELRRRLDEA